MQELTITKVEFLNMLSGFVESGVTYIAESISSGKIHIVFTGGY